VVGDPSLGESVELVELGLAAGTFRHSPPAARQRHTLGLPKCPVPLSKAERKHLWTRINTIIVGILCPEEPGSGQDSQESPEVGMVIRSSNGACGTAAWSVNCQNDSTLIGAANGCGSFDPIVK
jgi:hypothetical protein